MFLWSWSTDQMTWSSRDMTPLDHFVVLQGLNTFRLRVWEGGKGGRGRGGYKPHVQKGKKESWLRKVNQKKFANEYVNERDGFTSLSWTNFVST